MTGESLALPASAELPLMHPRRARLSKAEHRRLRRRYELRRVAIAIAFLLPNLIIIPTMLILGLLIALVLQNVTRGGSVLRALIYLPVLAPTVIVGLIWLFLLDPDLGAFNLFLRLIGRQPQIWLGSTDLALPSVAAMEIWRSIGFWALYFLAALIGMPRELYQAAHL